MMTGKLFYQIHIAMPFFFPTLAMICIKAVCKELPTRAIGMSIVASVVSLTVFYSLHLTLNGQLPYVYSATTADGQTGLGDGLISMMSFVAYPIAVVASGLTLYRNYGETHDNQTG